MPFSHKMKRAIFQAAVCSFLIASLASAQDGIIDLKFGQPPASDSDVARTLQSVMKVQGAGGLYQDGLYLMTHYGDREAIFRSENRRAIESPWREDTWRYCSIFSATAGSSTIMGRNWDNQNVGSIIVSLCRPPRGYSSISFSRAIDVGLPLNMDLEQIKSSELGRKLLLAPFYATDGINEHGLAVAVAGVRETTHKAENDLHLVFVTFLVRKLLDQTRSVDEAVNLAEQYIPFDLDKNSLNAHFFVVDSSGKSVILEYQQEQWRTVYGDNPWQALTNQAIYNVSDTDLRGKCRRYRSMSETLEQTGGDVSWKTGMGMLKDVAQQGTTWSVVYSLPTKELYFSVYQKWSVVYHLKAF